MTKWIVRWSNSTYVGPFNTKDRAEAYIRRHGSPDIPGKVLQLFTPFN